MLADPWRTQIALLPLRREYPDDKRSADPTKRAVALRLNRERAERAYASILDRLRAAGPGGLTAAEIEGEDKATGCTYRHLDAMAAAGLIRKNKISRNCVKWQIARKSREGGRNARQQKT